MQIKKLAVCGKGGSGKSTIVTLLANGMHDRGYHVLVVDSDESNSELYRLLGFDKAPSPIMDIIGGKKGVKQRMGSKLPVGKSEPQMTILEQNEISMDDIPPVHAIKKNGIALVSIGKIVKSLEGCACPMGVLSREFLAKLSLKENEVTIVDMEAGVEHFGRGVESSVDSVLIVVEPSFESLELAEKINGLAAGIGINNVWAVINKVTSEKMSSRLKTELIKRNVAVIGSVHNDTEIFQACLEGYTVCSRKGSEDIDKVLDALMQD